MSGWLDLKEVTGGYGSSQVLFGVSFSVDPGEVVTLMGRNGMGKTTTVRSIMGLNPISGGEIRIAGQSIRSLKSHQIAQLGIGYVPEGRQVFPNLTVTENLIATAANRFSIDDPWTLEKVMDLFPKLSALAHQYARTLSGGEQQMLAIGRALMTNPKFMILDEATEGLAPKIREEIWHVLEHNLKESGQAILVIDKHPEAMARIADRHYVMDKGSLVWQGTLGPYCSPMRCWSNTLACEFNEQQDLALNVRRAIPEHPEIFQQWRRDADRYREERPDALIDLEYGPDPRHRLDLFPAVGQKAGESAPLAIVIHGGYWQALDKADNRHVCRSFCDAGWTVALLNYRLCPAVDIGEICDDVEAATRCLVQQQQEWRLDCTDIAVIGHSAGAHLAAMLACRMADPQNALGARIGSLALVSGVFALESVIGTRMNERLSLDPSTANRWSPNRWDPPRAIRVDSTVGERETRGFFDQQQCLADAWRSSVNWSAGSIPDADHLQIWSQLADPTSAMAQRLVAHLGSKN